MKVILFTLAVVAALAFVAPVNAAKMTEQDYQHRLKQQNRAIWTTESKIRWWINHRNRGARDSMRVLETSEPRYVRVARKRLVWLKRERNETIAILRRITFRTLPNTNDWVTASRIVQRAFPGTYSWLLSCSAAESSHGKWVRYGGSSYYPGYEYTDAVGGWLQYRWSTFKPHYRRGLESLRSRGFIVDLPPPTDVRAWLSPLAMAIAGGWARWSGNDDSHWSASWNTGCR